MASKLWFHWVCTPGGTGDGMNYAGDGSGDSVGTVILAVGLPMSIARVPVGAFDIHTSAGLDGTGVGGDDFMPAYYRPVVLFREET